MRNIGILIGELHYDPIFMEYTDTDACYYKVFTAIQRKGKCDYETVVPINCYGSRARKAIKEFKKGDIVYVEYRADTVYYTDDKGKEQSKIRLSVIHQELIFSPRISILKWLKRNIKYENFSEYFYDMVKGKVPFRNHEVPR